MSYCHVTFEAKVRRVWHLDHLKMVCLLLGCPWDNGMPKRVLSVGCGTGTHLVPLAAEFPDTYFLGCDPEPQPLGRGRAFLRACPLRNLELVAGTAGSIGEGWFDVVLVQGVYSWISDEAQQRLLQECLDKLSPHGVLLLTHNVAPGWTIRRVVQEYLLSRGIHASDNVSREMLGEARRALSVFRDGISQDSAYGILLGGEVTRILGESDSYLCHEFLNPLTSGGPLSVVVDRLQASGLYYLGDVRISRNPFGVGSKSRGDAATQFDFCRGVAYRESLFTRRNPGLGFAYPQRARWEQLSYGCSLIEDEERRGSFRDPRGQEITFSPGTLRYAILQNLSQQWPCFLSWHELYGRTAADPDTFAECLSGFVYSELVMPAVSPPVYKPWSGEVTVPPWLGWELQSGRVLTNRLYEPVELGGFESALLASIVAGISSIEDLARETQRQLAESTEHRSLPYPVIRDAVQEGLETLARASLLEQTVPSGMLG